MKISYRATLTFLIITLGSFLSAYGADALLEEEDREIEGLPLYFYQEKQFINFGDLLSLKIVERMVGGEVKIVEHPESMRDKKLLALGSILIMARNHDVIWGTGMNGKRMDPKSYKFKNLDVRSVRGPMTRNFLITNFPHIHVPEVYGDPALLMPFLFPEFKRKDNPKYPYIIIPHYSEVDLFPKTEAEHIVYPTERWSDVVRKILDSELVISSSLHGLIVAEAYGVPARYLRVTDHEPLFKYQDYYLGTQRSEFSYATSIQEALEMGGEAPFNCNLKELYDSFPFEYWPQSHGKRPNFPDP